MNLKERAIAAAREFEERKREHQAEAAAQALANVKARFERVFGQQVDKIEGDNFYCDGLHLVYVPPRYAGDYSYHGHFALVGECPRCGEECFSEKVSSVTGLGQLLEKFEPDSQHTCPSDEEPTEAEPESWEDHLLDAIREAIYVEVQGYVC